MRYQMNRSGIGRMLKSHPGIHRQVHSAGRNVLAVARSRAPVRSGELKNSGRVEDRGVQRVYKGDPRMTVAVVFYAPHAMKQEQRTGFLSGAISSGRRTNGYTP